jgi:hypothetical protein
MANEENDTDVRSRLRQSARDAGCGVFDPVKPPLAGVAVDVLHAGLVELSRDQAFVQEILGDLFPEGCPANLDTFYSRVTLWDTELPASPDAHRLLAAVLAQARQTWQIEQERLLEALNSPNHEGFFPMLDALPVFLAENELPARFAAGWFVAIAERLRGDMGGGGFWLGLREFAAYFPMRALEVVDLLLSDKPTAQSMWVAARLLGVCRAAASSEAEKARLATTEARWASSRQQEERLYFHRSWMSTAGERALTPAEFATLLKRVDQGSEKEFEDAFFVVTQCLASVKTTAEVRQTGLAWLRKQASSALGPEPKFQIVAFVHNASEDQGDVDDLLWAVQPIALEHVGTWRLVETVLVKRLKEVPKTRFLKLFDGLANHSHGAFAATFGTSGLMERLPLELTQDKKLADGLLANLLFSYNGHYRRLGLRLFERLPTGTVSGDVFVDKEDAEVLLALLELRRSLPRPSAVADYLLLLAPYVEKAGAELKTEYSDEVLVQAKNLPGACLKRFKAEVGKSTIIDAAVAKAEAYVAALAAASNSPLAEMAVPGFARAWKEQQRRFQNDVAEGAKERSVWAQVISEVHVLYGDEFAVDSGGDINGTPFKESYIQIEVPSLEFIDPEGMTLRRLEAVRALERLEASQKIEEQQPPSTSVA